MLYLGLTFLRLFYGHMMYIQQLT